MGVDLIDCVKAQFPDHAEHEVTLVPAVWSKRVVDYQDHDYPWTCSCGAEGVLLRDSIGELLRADKVVTF